MAQVNVPMWDEGGHVVVYEIRVKGNDEDVAKIKRAVELVKFTADKKSNRSASEFIKQHFDAEIVRIVK